MPLSVVQHAETVVYPDRALPIVEAIGIAKHYGGVVALSGANLKVMPGEVVAIVGDNGAGKSTFVKILSGAQGASEGRLLVSGREISFNRPSDAREAGIETVYQDLSLAEHLDVLTPSDLAWEWLRRNDAYDADFEASASGQGDPEPLTERIRQRWGLRFPRRSAGCAT